MRDFELEQAAEAQADANAYSDAEILLHTRGIKLRMIGALTENDKMPTDVKEVNALMKVIDSIDRTAQNNIRNATEQDGNASVAEALGIIAAMQRQVGNVDPFKATVLDVTPREVAIEETLVEIDFVSGELSHEIRDLTYETFIDKHEGETGR